MALGVGYEAVKSGSLSALTNDAIDGGSWLWNCLTSGSCEDGTLEATPGAITAGSPEWSFSVGDGGTGKTYSGYGSSPDAAVSAALSVANSADNKLNGAEVGNCVVAGNGTSAACKYTTYYSSPSSTSNNATETASSPSTCKTAFASAVTSSACTDLSPSPAMPQISLPEQLLEWETPSQEAPQQLAPPIEADLINKIWQEASTDPDVEIPAPEPNDPVTGPDIQHERQVNPSLPLPYIPDTLQPAVTIPSGAPSTWTPGQLSPSTFPAVPADAPGTSTNPAPVSNPANGTTPASGTTTATASTTTSTSGGTTTTTTSGTGATTGGSGGTTLPPCGNLSAGEPTCEIDWNSTGASPPAAPAASDLTQVFSQLATLGGLSFWKSWTVSVPAGACQTFPIPFQSQTLTLDWCTPMNSMRGLVSTIETALIALATVTILLSA